MSSIFNYNFSTKKMFSASETGFKKLNKYLQNETSLYILNNLLVIPIILTLESDIPFGCFQFDLYFIYFHFSRSRAQHNNKATSVKNSSKNIFYFL